MFESRFAPRGAVMLACALACATAGAQSGVPSAAAASAAERAQRESDRTMYWIRVLADKPPPTKAAATPKPLAAAPAPAPAAAAKPVADAREKLRVAAAAAPTAQAATPANAGQPPALGVLPSAPDTRDPASQNMGADVAGAAAAGTLAMPQPEPAPAPPPDPGLTLVKSVQPDFPGNIVMKVRKGNVEVRFEVEPDGVVSDAVAVQSSNPRLNSAAVEAVKQWRFKPGPRGHTAAVNLVFDIDKEP